jgi:hypothetical protein
MCPASFKSNRLSWCRRASFYVAAVLTGQSINVEDAKQAASKLADAIAEEGLSVGLILCAVTMKVRINIAYW